MAGTSESPARSSRERTLAGLLRTAWENQQKHDPKLSQREIAKRCGVSHVTVGRWLSGETRVSLENAVTLLTAIGIVGDEREDILKIARGEGRDQPWVTSGPTGTSDQLAGVLEMERNALEMFEWSPLFVPGMLQTMAYARAIVGRPAALSEREIEHLVTLRLGRQHAILRDDPIHLTVVLGEAALRQLIGDSRVMIEQMKHLLKMLESAAVTLLVARTDGPWHGGLLGQFVLYTFANPAHSIVSLEHHRTGSFVDSTNDVEAYHELADDLRQLARSPEESRDVIKEHLRKWETTR